MTEQDFWQDHSERYLEMAFNTERRERVTNPDGYGKRTGECGDTVEMFLTVEEDRLKFVSYDVDGCVNTNACAATVSRLTEGKTVAEGWNLAPEDIIGYLETLPDHEIHCAELTAGAFYLALKDVEEGGGTS